MSVGQIARDFITSMNDVEAAKSFLAPDAVSAGGVLPQLISAREALGLLAALNSAFPDLKYDVQNVTVNGNRATVQVIWSGTHTGSLNFPLPGMPGILPTGKKVSVRDIFIVTVEGDKVCRIDVDTPTGGGFPAALDQIGSKVPGM